MTGTNGGDIGTQDLEKGQRPSRASTFPIIAAIVVAMLPTFDAAGFESLVRRLPQGPLSARLIEEAANWRGLMERLGPAKLFDSAKRKFSDALR